MHGALPSHLLVLLLPVLAPLIIHHHGPPRLLSRFTRVYTRRRPPLHASATPAPTPTAFTLLIDFGAAYHLSLHGPGLSPTTYRVNISPRRYTRLGSIITLRASLAVALSFDPLPIGLRLQVLFSTQLQISVSLDIFFTTKLPHFVSLSPVAPGCPISDRQNANATLHPRHHTPCRNFDPRYHPRHFISSKNRLQTARACGLVPISCVG
ncbi:hypothetical protein A0H81_03568 [Grifola frondosa]|uniref:Secreted protein n=1 Tax=Grifola frondosa TaxID=5627 RepID=A0A1C7MJU8_GRIFR|nr:hypothetical protein A0H81_03568 [Grifola frondosa]